MSTRRITTLYATLGWLLVCIVALLLAASAASAQSARDDRPMGFDEARHLLNRTSFAAQTSDIENYARLTRAEAVDRLLAETSGTPPSRRQCGPRSTSAFTGPT